MKFKKISIILISLLALSSTGITASANSSVKSSPVIHRSLGSWRQTFGNYVTNSALTGGGSDMFFSGAHGDNKWIEY